MKKRDLFWINKLIWIFSIALIFIFLFLHSIIQFNTSYIQEEKDELNVFKKQIEWAVVPLLIQKETESLKKYSADFEGEDIKFRIFDADKQIILSSNPSDLSPMQTENSNVLNKKTRLNIYKHSLKDKMIREIDEFYAGNSKYYIELTLLEEKVIGKIVKAQINLIILITFCTILLFLSIFQIICQFRSAFNKFDNSVLKIADGELDTELDVPKLEMLEELALAVKKMTQRLKKQIIRLKQLEEYKDEFLQNVSHEIKTPITAINMALELSETSQDEAQKKECLNIIQYQIKSINKLVNDILTLSEIDVEKTNDKKSFKDFKLNTMIEKVVNSFENNIIKINIFSRDEIIVNGNEDLMQSAIQNLITNAIKYSNSDTIDINLSKDETGIKIQVKDYGVGIKEEYQEKIFEKFYRIDKARSRKNGGTGLGLAIVKNIVELHKGEIFLQSKENEGANFIIKLPF